MLSKDIRADAAHAAKQACPVKNHTKTSRLPHFLTTACQLPDKQQDS
jgi:hypothetical protein